MDKRFISVLVLLCAVAAYGQKNQCGYSLYKEAGGWLKLHETPADWRTAKLICQQEGTELVTPSDKLKGPISDILLQYNIVDGVFTGIHSYSAENDSSIEGIPIPQDWDNEKLETLRLQEQCFVIYNDGGMKGANCSISHPFMCFKNEESQSVEGDACGPAENGYQLYPSTGSCYKLHRDLGSWSGAIRTCAKEGGLLAVINSDNEAEIIKELMSTYPTSSTWDDAPENTVRIGVRRTENDMTWKTVQGQTLSEAGYDKFSAGEPNNAAGNQYCVGIYRNALMDDITCHRRYPYICEKSPKRDFCPQHS